MTTPKLTEIANPAAVGWRWTSESGTLYEITWVRGGHTLTLGVKAPDGKWLITNIDSPERFLSAPTLKAARIAAHKFVEAGDDD